MKKKDEKVKIDAKKIWGKFIALFMLIAMVLASCSTFIYYIVKAIK